MLVGIDIGTTNLKVAAYAPERGTLAAVVRRATRTHRPRPGWAEFDPAELWAETADALREIVHSIGPAPITGVAIGSMGESGVLLDARMRPLGPVIAWYDRRTEDQVNWWRERIDPWTIYQVTGQMLDAKFSVNHLLWFRQHAPEVWAAARHWLCIPDYLAWKLCGQSCTDRTMAARTMLFDQRQQTWSAELLDLANLPVELLPRVVDSGSCVGEVSPAAATATGLPVGTPVVSGGHDHLVGAVAAGLLRPGSVLDSSGTASAVVQLTDTFAPGRALFEAGLEISAFPVVNTFSVLASTNLAGGAVEWLVRLLWGTGPEANAVAFEAAAAAPRGSAGAMWLPHLLGSGTPHADPISRGALVGLRPEHERGHLLRGLLESLAYWLRENLEVTAQHTQPSADGEIVAIGGATRSALWTQIKADACGRPFCVPRLEESVALGAALLAGVGAGVFTDLNQAVTSVKVDRQRFQPDPAATAIYDRWYADVYRALYPALKNAHAAIDRLSHPAE